MGERTERLRQRFTPTCVGKTAVPERPSLCSPVHPHVRGEDGRRRRKTPTWFGSPPRAWGRLGFPFWSVRRSRFTPTCVGKTFRTTRIVVVIAVHPHVRGEDVRLAELGDVCAGSPPRAWGRRHHQQRRGGRHRFTPTCVGKTAGGGAASAASFGSPPRAWGRRPKRVSAAASRRFTPTCVGKTPRSWPCRAGRRFTPTCVGKTMTRRRSSHCPPVHPHVRGEDGVLRKGDPREVRFTPTCVGKTSATAGSSTMRTVHPHVRGEDEFAPRIIQHAPGSPPRAWGRRHTTP